MALFVGKAEVYDGISIRCVRHRSRVVRKSILLLCVSDISPFPTQEGKLSVLLSECSKEKIAAEKG